jgi:hypothetical protein
MSGLQERFGVIFLTLIAIGALLLVIGVRSTSLSPIVGATGAVVLVFGLLGAALQGTRARAEQRARDARQAAANAKILQDIGPAADSPTYRMLRSAALDDFSAHYVGFEATRDTTRLPLDLALAALTHFDEETLELLRVELERDDGFVPGTGGFLRLHNPGISSFLVDACRLHVAGAMPTGQRTARELILGREIRLSYGDWIYDQVTQRIERVYSPQGTPIDFLTSRFGRDDALAALAVCCSIASIHIARANRYSERPGRMNIHRAAQLERASQFVTEPLLELIAAERPDDARLVEMARTGALAEFGVTPADLDPVEFAERLSRYSRPSRTNLAR